MKLYRLVTYVIIFVWLVGFFVVFSGCSQDGGAGIYFTKSKVQLGIETSYRWMKYNYTEPSGNEVSATDDHVDGE